MRAKGLYTALITPFKNDAIDVPAFEAFVDWQIREGVHGLLPCGTTGESPTLSHEEHKKVVEITVKVAAGRVPVMAGTGSNATAEAIDFTRHAEKIGAASALIVAPYYNKPTPQGIIAHYSAIANASALPLYIYNIPGRSVINISDSTLEKLAEIPTIAGIKDATGDLARVATLKYAVADRFALLSGEDMTAVGFNAMGGQGCFSVVSNLIPKRCAEIQNLTLASKYDEARAEHAKTVGLIAAMFSETNPIPVKYAAHLLGKCSAELRLPLVLPSESTQASIRKALVTLNLL